ncbi:MFS transporter [Mycobacteroides abscessus]|uniref:MFS transporter n=1 Tax=Mycobacteroides abscessus TaxID=36809 RepID=UPI0009A7E24C|nr:MFS transporter [Mycobacteroides abscessus]
MKNSAQGPASGSARTLPRSVVALLAIATATSVAVAYYSQPLLDAIGTDLGIPATVAPLIVTLTQLGFAASLFLILPLGDMLNRRRLIVGLSVLSALVLGLTALAPTGTWVLWLSPLVGAMAVVAQLLVALTATLAPAEQRGRVVGTVLVGAMAVVAQLLVALTATLAPAEQRGRVVGTVMSGLLIGILLARTAAGLIADLAGWRAVYVTAATSMLAVAAALARRLPSEESAGTTRNYIRLLGSVLDLVYQQKVLRTRMLFGAIAFAQFSVLWTALTSLLSGEPYGYSEGVIGLFGVIGAAGALGARFAGKLADSGRSATTTLGAAITMLVSWPALLFGGDDLIALVLGILLLDFGVQAMHVTNQSQIYALPGDARSRITSAYMTAYFAGGALGSAAVSVAGSRWGWTGVCTVGAGFALLQLLTAALRPRESSQAIGALSVCSQDKNLWSLGESNS